MRLYTLLLSLTSSLLPAAVVSQDTSRIRTRTGTLSNVFCTNTGAAATATTTFAPLLSVHLGSGEECPQSAALGVHYHNENDIGCCTQSAVLTAVAPDGKLACCGCGTTCTGVVPGMVDWTFTNGQFITTTETGTETGQPTKMSSSPFTTGSPTTSATTTTTTTTTTTATAGSAPSALNVGYTALLVGFFVGVFAGLLA